MHAEKNFISLHCAILTVSDTRSLKEDTSGDYLQEAVEKAGHKVADRHLLRDDIYLIRECVSRWIASESVQVILITGGTGFYGRDNTPEAVRVLFDKEIDGFGELFRNVSSTEIGTATIQSRALAGMANHTLIFCLPGSTNACRTAWEKIIASQLDARTRPCSFVKLITEKL